VSEILAKLEASSEKARVEVANVKRGQALLRRMKDTENFLNAATDAVEKYTGQLEEAREEFFGWEAEQDLPDDQDT
jgi:hypothetical protein